MTRFENSMTEGLPPATEAPRAADARHRSLTRIIWSRRLIILLATLVFTVGAFVYVQLATPIYMAGARLHIQDRIPKAISGGEVGGQTESRTGIFTECELIHSIPVLVAAIESQGVKDLQTFAANRDNALADLSKHLTITPGKQDDLVTVAYESPYPNDIPRIVNAVVNAYIQYQTNRKRETVQDVLSILEKEKRARNVDVNTSLQAMLEFKKLHPEVGFQGDKANIIVQRLERLSGALTEAELALVDAKADDDSLAAMKGDKDKIRQFFATKRVAGQVVVGAQDETDRLQGQLNDHQITLKALQRESHTSQKIENEEEAIKTIKNQIAERVDNEAALQVAIVEQGYKSAQERLARVQEAYDKQLEKATNLNQEMNDYAGLENDYEQAKKLVEMRDSQMKELNITAYVGAEMNISVVEPPSRPDKPVKPDKFRIVGIAFVVGLMIGVGLAMLRDWRDPYLATSEEISAAVGVPVVAMLPELKDKQSRQDVSIYGRNVLEFPRSPMAEAYRGLRTTLTLGMADFKAKTILVTSPAANDGKSTLVSNLGIAMAQAGRRTLVLDADFRRPRQHNIFKIANDVGLSAVLQNGGNFAAAIVHSEQSGLDIMPAGTIPAQPSELLGGRALIEMLSGLSQRYDLILIDSPPVTAVVDSLILAARSDATLLVMRAENSHRHLAEETRKALAGVGARVCGAVINATSPKKFRHGYHSQYGDNTVVEQATGRSAQDGMETKT